MDLAKDTNNIVLYWVTKVETHNKTSTFLWGTPLSGDHGFGGQSISYHGSALLISPRGRRNVQDLSLVRGHENRRGFFLAADKGPDTFFPEVPFLITNQLSINFLRKEDITFLPSREWAELEEDDGRLIEHWVCNAGWLGLLQIDTKKSNRKGILWIFSDRPDVSIPANTQLTFCDNPEESYGTVTG